MINCAKCGKSIEMGYLQEKGSVDYIDKDSLVCKDCLRLKLKCPSCGKIYIGGFDTNYQCCV